MPRPKMIGPKSPCTVEGCLKPHLARGYCGAHWALWKKYGKPEKLEHTVLKECSAEGCVSAPRSTYAEYCEKHYMRLRRRGTLEGAARIAAYADTVGRAARPTTSVRRALKDPQYLAGTTCMAEGCEADAKCSIDPANRRLGGWCRMHFLRMKTRGDLNFELKNENHPKWTGDAATNRAVHQRIHKRRGKAKSWGCMDCARPAQHWSYDHSDPNELADAEKGPYSLDMDRYLPRCASCHKVFDIKHSMTERAS